MHRKMCSPIYIIHSEGRAAFIFPLCHHALIFSLTFCSSGIDHCQRMELLGQISHQQMKEIHRESRKTERPIIVYLCSVFFEISIRHSQHTHPAPLPWLTYIKVSCYHTVIMSESPRNGRKEKPA